MVTGLSKAERETIIRFDEELKSAEIFSYNGALNRQLRNLNKKQPRIYIDKGTNGSGAHWWRVPKNTIRIIEIGNKKTQKELQMAILGLKDVMKEYSISRKLATRLLSDKSCPTLPRKKNQNYYVTKEAFDKWLEQGN